MIQPTFSRISSKLLRGMFGSTLWHPAESSAADTQTGHVKKNKNKTDLMDFCSPQPASHSVSACGRRAIKEGTGHFATGKGS